jgi:hypothetical protein
MRTRRVAVMMVVVAVGSGAPPARGADLTVRGGRLLVTDPKPEDPARRKVVATARGARGTSSIAGDPTVAGEGGGAVLEVVANGARPSFQSFLLPQGTTAKGKPFWRAAGSRGYRYADPAGEQGGVSSVVLKQAANGAVRLQATLLGRNGPLAVTPPDPGTDGFLTLALGGGDRLCVQYGPEGRSRNRADRLWEIGRVRAEGCSPTLTSGSFLALSYNVAGLPEGISGSHPEVNTPLISPLLNRYDLVLVQESWQTPEENPFAPLRVYHELLVVDAEHPYRSVPATHPLGMDPTRPTAILGDGLNRFSRFPFEPVVRTAWATCHPSAADCLAFKGFSVARTTLAPGLGVDVYNLHMEAGGDPEDDQARDAGVAQLAAFIATFSVDRAVIVGGDFNLHTDREPDATIFQRLLTEAGLTDVCAALACPEPGRIDKFTFRSGGGVTITPLSWRFETDVFVRDDGEPLSDHDALAVRFGWSAAGGVN